MTTAMTGRAYPVRNYTLGDRLRELRRDRKLTQEQLAEKSGVSLSLITKLESGARDSLRLGTAAALAGALGVGVGELLGDDPHPAPPPPRRGEQDRQLGARVRELLAEHGMSVRELEAVFTVAARLHAARAEVRELAEAVTR